jgi:uncharacterized protein (TIGR00369 family)
MADHLNEISPAAVLLGREIVSVDTGSGEVRLRFLAAQQFSNRHGTVQGGLLAAMLDSATGNAVIANLPSDRTAVTTRLDTTFVKPSALGPLTATGRLVKLHAARLKPRPNSLMVPVNSWPVLAPSCVSERDRGQLDNSTLSLTKWAGRLDRAMSAFEGGSENICSH